jgi:hypothetical protein
MASHTSLDDRVSSGRHYMNKLFGRDVERARALERNGRTGNPLGPARRVTIEPQSSGGHRVVVERSAVVEQGDRPSSQGGRIAGSSTSEHSFGSTGDAMRFLSDVLNDRPPSPSGTSSEGGRPDAFTDTGRSVSTGSDRFLDQVLDENGGSSD